MVNWAFMDAVESFEELLCALRYFSDPEYAVFSIVFSFHNFCRKSHQFRFLFRSIDRRTFSHVVLPHV